MKNKKQKGILRRRGYLLAELVSNSIKKRYRRSLLGVLWSMLNPLLTMAVQAFIFSSMFRHDIPNYLLYLITGQILFNFYSEGSRTGMRSVIAHAPLIKKVKMPAYMFPVSAVAASCVNLVFALPALAIIMAATGARPTWALPAFLLPLLLMLVFCTGVSLILSSLAVFFRDVLHLYGVFLTMLHYATPIFYSDSNFSARKAAVLRLNPLVHFVKAFRAPLYRGTLPDGRTLLFCALFSFAALAAGALIYRLTRKKFILYI